MIKYFRRTPAELKSFQAAKKQLLAEGYPEHIAEQYCWDFFHAARRGRRVNV